MREMSPLPGSFMLISMLGFIITTILFFGERFTDLFGPSLGPSLAFSFNLIFILMFIASVASVTPSFPKDEGILDMSEFKPKAKKKK